MRLTLRTLLAWLDDTLSASEVRQIGQNVAESPVARELVERINRVTRQRRLAVPSSNGPDSTDPNLVASYLDNELTPEEVAEYEKRCLTSDVHLAEVASVHQILSLIGQKAKVPPEARFRMYRLVKGREAVNPRMRPAPVAPRESMTQPIEQWIGQPKPTRSWVERFGPALAVLGLIAVLSWSAWMSVGFNPTQLDKPVQPVEDRPVAKVPEIAIAARPRVPQAAPIQPPPQVQEDEPKVPAKEAVADRAPAMPDGVLAVASRVDGTLLRKNPETRDWDRLAEGAQLSHGDVLVNLSLERSSVQLRGIRLDLVGQTEIRLARSEPAGDSSIELVQGRLVAHLNAPEDRLRIVLAEAPLIVHADQSVRLGLERTRGAVRGDNALKPALLQFLVPEGSVSVAAGDEEHILQGPGVHLASLMGGEFTRVEQPVPWWVGGEEAPPIDRQIAEQFSRYLLNDRPTLTCLVEAVEDEQPEVRAVAIRGLGMLGDLSLILPELSRSGNRSNRRTAIEVIRGYASRGPESVAEVYRELERFFGSESADKIAKLLEGHTADEAGREGVRNQLLQGLTSSDVAIRELSLDNLRAITGRDDLEYDPDQPEGKGLKAWQDLLQSK